VWDFGKYAFDHSDKAVAWYQYAEYALAMRGHGQIVPICFNVPVISLENHPKHRGLMEKLGLADYNISVQDPHFVNNCTALVRQLEANKDALRQQLKSINQRLYQDTRIAFEQIKERISFITC